MKKITILTILVALLSACASTKHVQPVAKIDLINVVNDFNNYLTEDYIDSVAVFDLIGRRIINLHAEQADELVMPKAGIYVVSVKSAKGLHFGRKVIVDDDSTRELRQKFWRERNKIQ